MDLVQGVRYGDRLGGSACGRLVVEVDRVCEWLSVREIVLHNAASRASFVVGVNGRYPVLVLHAQIMFCKRYLTVNIGFWNSRNRLHYGYHASQLCCVQS